MCLLSQLQQGLGAGLLPGTVGLIALGKEGFMGGFVTRGIAGLLGAISQSERCPIPYYLTDTLDGYYGREVGVDE